MLNIRGGGVVSCYTGILQEEKSLKITDILESYGCPLVVVELEAIMSIILLVLYLKRLVPQVVITFFSRVC